MSIDRITVVGGGTMGNGIAHVCAQSAHRVTLVDTEQDLLERALNTIFKNLDRQVKKELISAGEKDEALGRISTTVGSTCDMAIWPTSPRCRPRLMRQSPTRFITWLASHM